MHSLLSRLGCLSLLGLVIVTGCASHGSEFLGKWVNTRNQNDTMEVVRNGDQFLIASEKQKIGAVYKDGSLEIQGVLGQVAVTYIKKSDTILTPGFFGQVEYKRQK